MRVRSTSQEPLEFVTRNPYVLPLAPMFASMSCGFSLLTSSPISQIPFPQRASSAGEQWQPLRAVSPLSGLPIPWKTMKNRTDFNESHPKANVRKTNKNTCECTLGTLCIFVGFSYIVSRKIQVPVLSFFIKVMFLTTVDSSHIPWKLIIVKLS